MQFAAPRQFGPATAALSQALAGLPADRRAHAAARKSFVDLKRTFMHALAGVPDVDWLHAQVRAAEDPTDLWLLRGPALAALAGADAAARQRRQQLRRGLDSMFPDLDDASDFGLL